MWYLCKWNSCRSMGSLSLGLALHGHPYAVAEKRCNSAKKQNLRTKSSSCREVIAMLGESPETAVLSIGTQGKKFKSVHFAGVALERADQEGFRQTFLTITLKMRTEALHQRSTWVDVADPGAKD